MTELEIRRSILLKSIEIINKQTGDTRQGSALDYYVKQLMEVEEAIKNSKKPSPIVIKLKPGTVGASAPRLGE
jgi:hypothetical protein